MKTYALAFILVITLTSGARHAQSQERRVAYLSKDNKQVSGPSEAAYYRTLQEAGDSFIVREYFIPSNKVRLVAECLEVDPEIVYHGTVKHYYESGALQEEEQYDEGYATGFSTDYYKDGKVRVRKEHSGDSERILQYYTPDGRALLTNGNGSIINQPVPEGDTLYAEIKEYKLIAKYTVANSDTVYSVTETLPEFPGGPMALMRYLTKNMRYPSESHRYGIEGSVYVKFEIDRHGKLSNVRAARSVASDLDAEAIRVIRTMPDWKPARVNGKSVKSTFLLPIKFKLGRR
jgi:TonB family protein